jgi:hypothetical protein
MTSSGQRVGKFWAAVCGVNNHRAGTSLVLLAAFALSLPQGAAGVEKLCSDLKVDPTDRSVLLLAWKVGGRASGCSLLDAWQSAIAQPFSCYNA